MHRRRWCTEDDAPKVVMHRMWWCTAGGDAFFCIFGFFNIKYFLLDFLHFLLFWGIFLAFFCIFGFVGIFAFFCISSSLFIMWSGGLCWLLTDKRVQLFYAFPEGISSFHFSRGHPLSYTKYADKKQIRLAPVWWWLRSWITKVPTVQFTQCNCKCRLQYFLQLHDCILLFNYLSTPPDTHMEQS